MQPTTYHIKHRCRLGKGGGSQYVYLPSGGSYTPESYEGRENIVKNDEIRPEFVQSVLAMANNKHYGLRYSPDNPPREGWIPADLGSKNVTIEVLKAYRYAYNVQRNCIKDVIYTSDMFNFRNASNNFDPTTGYNRWSGEINNVYYTFYDFSNMKFTEVVPYFPGNTWRNRNNPNNINIYNYDGTKLKYPYGIALMGISDNKYVVLGTILFKDQATYKKFWKYIYTGEF